MATLREWVAVNGSLDIARINAKIVQETVDSHNVNEKQTADEFAAQHRLDVCEKHYLLLEGDGYYLAEFKSDETGLHRWQLSPIKIHTVK